MERQQLLGSEDIPRLAGIPERCRECRGRLARVGEEVACASCGVVARTERTPIAEGAAETVQGNPGRRLGSYLGRRSDEDSTADFNGICTVGYAKRVSDHMDEDQALWNCIAMIRRAADKLSLPAFVRDNAVAVSEKMLADRREDERTRLSWRTTVPAISAYALLSACRTAGMDHVGAKAVLRTFADQGHRVTKSKLLRLGTESYVPLRPADPSILLRTVVGCLGANASVARRLARSEVEPGPYFRRLLQASQTIVGAVHGVKEGNSPRTVAAASVYLASREIGPRIVTQKDAAEALGVAECTVREFTGLIRRELGPPAPGQLNGGPH
jgi:transcription initiation factor TFIIIB Brf1 subunit/transcription initiation factor TFIIB